MAGPYDMLLTAQTILKENIYPAPENMAFVFYAYNNIYVWNKLNYIFNSPYAENIPQLFNGSYSTDQIDAALPDSINELLKQTFIDSLLQNEEPTITNAFINNSLINWDLLLPPHNFIRVTPMKLSPMRIRLRHSIISFRKAAM